VRRLAPNDALADSLLPFLSTRKFGACRIIETIEFKENDAAP